MERTHRTTSLPWRPLGVALLLAAALLAGCGDQKDYANDPRPPSPINVAAYISSNRVSVSPSSFGAGPIVVIVTNQAQTSQSATFEAEGLSGDGSGLSQSTGPINPGDTAEIKLLVHQGTYRLRAGSDSIAPATVTVGSKRASAQNKVLQP